MSLVGNSRRPRRVIVSGGIGSGKTTVLRILENLGAVVIEADRIGHEILEPGGPAFGVVAARWPQVVVDGRIDRRRLAAIVFNDSDQLHALEAITHPMIADLIAQRVAAAGSRDIALELPVGGRFDTSDWTRIIVAAPEDVRLARAMARGMEREDAAGRIAAQREQPGWVTAAHAVIENSSSLTALAERVVEVWEQLATAG